MGFRQFRYLARKLDFSWSKIKTAIQPSGLGSQYYLELCWVLKSEPNFLLQFGLF